MSRVDFEDTIEEASAATTFEREFESLILRSFSEGAVIGGEWAVELPVADAPNWTDRFKYYAKFKYSLCGSRTVLC